MTELIDRLLPIPEAAKALAISERTLRWWVQIGKIGSNKNGETSGGRRTIPASEVNRIIRETSIPARPEYLKEAAQKSDHSLAATV